MKTLGIAIFAVARATLREAIRSRLLLVGLFFALILVGLSIAAASVSFGERGRLIVDVGLAATSALGSLITVALTVLSFAGEITKRTAYPTLARPIPRWAFVLGKYLGVCAAMQLVVILMVTATALTVWIYGDPVPNALWASAWLTCMEIAVVAAVALLFSSMTVPVLAATYAVGVWLAGSLAADILRLAEKMQVEGKLFGSILEWLYFLVPDLEKLSLRSQAANNLPLPSGYLFYGTGYAFAYIIAALVVTMWVFSRRRAI